MPEDEKKVIKPIFIDKVGKKKSLVGSGKNVFSTCHQYEMWRYRNILGHMKTWYNSENIGNFVDFYFIAKMFQYF